MQTADGDVPEAARGGVERRKGGLQAPARLFPLELAS
jgi:hypothetical protein